MDAHKNFSYSLIATAPSPALSGTSLVVTTGEGALFPTPPFNVTVWPEGTQPLSTNAEIVRVTGIVGDTFTIVRAQEGSAARAIQAGDQIAATITAKTIEDLEDEVDPANEPTYAGLTVSGLTASRLVATDGLKKLASVALLSAWIAGTANQVVVASDGSGGVVLSGPQDLAAGSSPTFAGLTLTGLTTPRVPFVGAGDILDDDSAFNWDDTNKQLYLFTSGGNTSNRLYVRRDYTDTSGVPIAVRIDVNANPSGASSAAYEAQYAQINTLAANSNAITGSINAFDFIVNHASPAAVTTCTGVNATVQVTNATVAGGTTLSTISRSFNSSISLSGTGNVSNAIGFGHTTAHTGSGTITTSACFWAFAPTGSGTITSSYGVKVENQGRSGVTNAYGIRIENQTGAATLNYALHSLGGQSRLLSGAAAVIPLVLQGAAAQSASLQEWWNSSSSIMALVGASGSFLAAGYARVGSTSAPANTTAGDVTITRLACGVDSAFGVNGRIARFAGTNTNTASGADMGINVELTYSPAANASTEIRAINFRNLITPDTGVTVSRIQGGYFANTNRSDAAATNLVGVVGFGMFIDSSSPSTVGTVTNVYGFDARVYARPSGTSTVSITNAVAYDTTLWVQNSGATITNAYGVRLIAPGSGSTITSLAGLAVAQWTRATNNTGLLLGTTTIPSGNFGIYNALSDAAHIGNVTVAAGSQSGNLEEWRDSSGNLLSTISENGYFTTRKTSAPADGELAASELAIWFDSANGASKVKFKGKSADGTVVTGEVALA